MNKFKKIISSNKKPFYWHDLNFILDELDIREGDIILLHASLSSFGYLLGGEETIINTILKKIGENGTLVIPTQSVELSNPESWEYPPAPSEWFEDLRKYMLPYNPKKTIVSPNLGKVASYFCMYPNVIRSDHPLYSFSALGKDAFYLMADHSLDYGLGKNSPLGKMYDMNAKVLMLGTDFETNTSIHLAEYYLNRDTIFEEAPIMVDGEKEWVKFKNIDLDIYDDFLLIQEEFTKNNPCSYKSKELYNGKAITFRMKECVDFVINYYQSKE